MTVKPESQVGHIVDTIPESVCEKQSCTVGIGGGNWFLGPAGLPDSWRTLPFDIATPLGTRITCGLFHGSKAVTMKKVWPPHPDSYKRSSMQSCRSSAWSYGTRTLRSTRSRLALRRRALRGFSWHAGRRPRLATVASDGRFMGQLYDWEGPLGHKRPTGMMSIFGAPAFHCHSEGWGRSSCPWGAFARRQSTRRPVRWKAVFDLCYNGTSCSASQAPSCVHFQSGHHPQVPLSFWGTWPPTPPDFRTCHLRYARALPFCPQHWLLCHLGLY